jgi:hypothetical protein
MSCVLCSLDGRHTPINAAVVGSSFACLSDGPVVGVSHSPSHSLQAANQSAGIAVEGLVESVDLYPTIASLAGLPPPPDLDGV